MIKEMKKTKFAGRKFDQKRRHMQKLKEIGRYNSEKRRQQRLIEKMQQRLRKKRQQRLKSRKIGNIEDSKYDFEEQLRKFLYESIKVAVKNYLDENGIAPEDFKWPEAENELSDGSKIPGLEWMLLEVMILIYGITKLPYRIPADSDYNYVISRENKLLMKCIFDGILRVCKNLPGNSKFGIVEALELLDPAGNNIPENVKF